MNIYAWLHIVTALVSSTLALLVWRNRIAGGGIFIILLMLAVTIWALGYGMELASTDLPNMIFWVRIEYLGITTGPICWLLFTIRYTGHHAWLTRRSIGALFIIPIITILLNVTNEAHHLFYRTTGIDTSSSIPLFALQAGPWYWVQVSYSLMATLLGAWLILWMWQQTPRAYRGQLSIMLVGACFPLAVNIMYLLGIRLLGHIDLTPLALTGTCVLVYWGLFRYHLFDVSPLARNALFEQLHDAVIVLDIHHRIVDLNRTAEQLFGQLLTTVIGYPAAAAFTTWPELAMFCQNPDSAEEMQLAHLSSHTYDVRRTMLLDQHGNAIGTIIVLRDSTSRTLLETEREQLIAQLQDLAHTDGLTGIANRRAFMAAADQEWQRAVRLSHPISAILLDIDHFKLINDSYGHAAGDKVLYAVAQCCHEHLRSIDLVGRYGGEEFAILLPATESIGAYEVAERLRAQVSALMITIDTVTIQLTISIGVAVAYPPVITIEDVFYAADMALYVAKRQGRDRVHLAEERLV